jgi:hypothetical protein
MRNFLFWGAIQSTAVCTKSLCHLNNKNTSLWTFSRKEIQHFFDNLKRSSSRASWCSWTWGGGGVGCSQSLPRPFWKKKSNFKTIQNIAFVRSRLCRYSRQHLQHKPFQKRGMSAVTLCSGYFGLLVLMVGNEKYEVEVRQRQWLSVMWVVV